LLQSVSAFIAPARVLCGPAFVLLINNRKDFIPMDILQHFGNKHDAEIIRRENHGDYYIRLKDKYPDKVIATVTNNPEEKILEILVDIFNKCT
jgi:hypothetical protein